MILDYYVEFKVNDENWKLVWPPHDMETFSVIVEDWSKQYPEISSRLKGRTRTVIQAGGHCGLYAKLHACGFERVFTFEPELENFMRLTINCNDTRIIKINAALGDTNDFVSMGIVSYVNTGMHKVLPKGIYGLIAYSVTIDSIKPKDVDLIHLDVEGYEYNALKGAVNTIKKYKPLIVVEMTEKVDKIYKLLDTLGYKEVKVFGGKSKNSIFEYVQ